MMPKLKPTRWHKLDNTANLFPVVASKRFTNVYRITAVMRDEIDPVLLQKALETMLPYFAAFHVRLRHGLFWSYLETNRATPHVEEEQDNPCSYLDQVQTDRYLFRMLYYKKRVHLEAFHVLSDGTGAGRFLRAVCYCYCKLKYPSRFTKEQHNMLHGTEHASNIEDGYVKNYRPTEKRSFREPAAYLLRGEARIADDTGVLTALVSMQGVKALARSHGAPVGVYLTALLGYAVYQEYMAGLGAKKPINIFVPVNLRPIFNTETSLNFFSNILVGLSLAEPDISFEAVLAEVKKQFAEKCTKEYMAQKLSYTVQSEHSLWTRMAPLPVKNGILRMIFEGSSHGNTISVSNLGLMEILPEFAEYFESFRVMLSPSPREPVKVSAISVGDTLALTFSTALEGCVLGRNMVRQFTRAGLEVVVESNDGQEEHNEAVSEL